MFDDQTTAAILQRMLTAIAPDIDKRQGSVAYDLLAPSALELAQAYIALTTALELGYAETASGEYLDRRAAERGITRKAAVAAEGYVTFAGAVGTAIPAGTTVTTSGDIPIAFTTQAAAVVGQSVAVRAAIAGASGNVAAGAVNLVVGNLAGVLTVTNTAAFTSGSDAESDDSLRARYFDDVRTPATSGNSAHYREWAKEVAGVYDARVFPLWNGPNTVKVALLAEDKRAPGQSVIDAANAHIQEMRPILANVTVVGVTEILANISVKLTLKEGGVLADAVEQIRANVTKYLADLAFNDLVVRYAKIAECILNAADVLDYENLTVNGGTGNFQLAEDQVAVTGAIVTTN
ncbi:baseplate J/gp47 family protein [Paenibacillus humicus]|uniref:baseplate J/gp47 family protein n=1 Tax=Paenibacillus humicus TaxID=412861 RepID=UPI000FDBFB7F|nr:baseplate J/gp47 family protein [Paenibacillus humicus]